MRIYFEDGPLWSNMRCNTRIDSNNGVSACLDALDSLRRRELESGEQHVVYTNFPLALDNKYAWSNKRNRPEIYLRAPDESWRNIVYFTSRRLRPGHNIMKLYLSGEFDMF